MLFNLCFFVICVAAYLWFVPRWGFVKRAGLSDTLQRVLILFKIAVGFIAAAYLGSVPNSDHLAFNNSIAEQYQILVHHPGDYFNEIWYQRNQHGTGGLFAASGSFWGYIRYHLVYMFTAPLNFISGGNFYLNSALFSLFTYFGHLFFFRIYQQIYPGHSRVMLLACFLIPSLLLFTACVHKDGFVFVGLSIMSYVFLQLLREKKLSWKYSLAFLLAAACIFLLRNYVLVAVLPAMLVAFVAGKWPKNKFVIVTGLYLLFAILFFLSGRLSNSFDLPEAVVKRKQDFAALEGAASNLSMNELQPTAFSFLENTPQALSHSFLRPIPFESGSLSSIAAGLEVYIYLFIFALALWYKRKTLADIHQFNMYGFAFFVTMVLIIGLTIPNLGSIVRYRSLLWVFVLAPALYQLASSKTGSTKRIS